MQNVLELAEKEIIRLKQTIEVMEYDKKWEIANADKVYVLEERLAEMQSTLFQVEDKLWAKEGELSKLKYDAGVTATMNERAFEDALMDSAKRAEYPWQVFARMNRKIWAIKALRTQDKSFGLKEAKDHVEAWINNDMNKEREVSE